MKILLVEDDPNFGPVLRSYLKIAGYEVILAETGEDALYQYQAHKYTLEIVITDIMLPGQITGHEVAKAIDEDKKSRAVVSPKLVFLTAKDSDADMFTGYGLGAIDYLKKPFDPVLLLHKIKALLGVRGEVPNLLQEPVLTPAQINRDHVKEDWIIGFFLYSYKFRTLKHMEAGTIIDLSPTENDLLALLLEFKDDVLPREIALSRLWSRKKRKTTNDGSRSMDVYITKLRGHFNAGNKEAYDHANDDLETGRKGIRIINKYKEGFMLIVEGYSFGPKSEIMDAEDEED